LGEESSTVNRGGCCDAPSSTSFQFFTQRGVFGRRGQGGTHVVQEGRAESNNFRGFFCLSLNRISRPVPWVYGQPDSRATGLQVPFFSVGMVRRRDSITIGLHWFRDATRLKFNFFWAGVGVLQTRSANRELESRWVFSGATACSDRPLATLNG